MKSFGNLDVVLKKKKDTRTKKVPHQISKGEEWLISNELLTIGKSRHDNHHHDIHTNNKIRSFIPYIMA